MGETTGIAWTDATWNPWQGCTKVSRGCDFCYAEALDNRWGRDFSKVRRSADSIFYAPLRWKEPKLVFTCSMSDFFHRQADPWREEAWDIMRRTPHLTYQVLTKRPGLAVHWYKRHGWLDNVWLGTSVELAKYLPRLYILARVPAPVRFLSAEPLLSELNLWPYILPSRYCRQCQLRGWREIPTGEESLICPAGHETLEAEPVVDWVITGAESGPKRRPMEVSWVQSIVDQSRAADVPLFVKQGSSLWPGKQGQLPDELWQIKEMPKILMEV